MTVKTTVYLPDDLKLAIEHRARLTGRSEAEVIREALRQSIAPERPRPRGGFLRTDDPIADQIDELLTGFGES